ncbi:MAG: GC-type dockerin domain-anchored protein [Phycisphaerales bacterium]
MLLAAVLWVASAAVAQTCDPRLIGGDGGTPQGIAVKGNTVYLDRGNGVQLFDVSDWTQPVPIGRIFLPDRSRDMVANGDRLYVSTALDTMHVFDISAPTSPIALGVASIEDHGSAFIVGGGVAFFPRHDDGLLGIVDLRDPTRPVERGFFSWHQWGLAAAFVRPGASVVCAYYEDYRSSQFDYQCHLLRHDDPSRIGRLGTFDLPVSARHLSVSDEIAFVSADGLRTFDVGVLPLAPLGVLDEIDVKDMAHRPGLAFTVTESQSFAVIDTSDPSDLHVIAEVNLPSQGNAIAVDSGHALIAGRSGLYVLNVFDPSNPRLVGQVPLFGGVALRRPVKVNDLIIGVDGSIGTNVVSIADASRPEVVPVVDLFLGGNDVTAIGDHVLCTQHLKREVRIMDLSDPTASWLMRGRIYLPGYANRITTDGALAYISTNPYGAHPGGVGIYNIDDPYEPRLVEQLDFTYTGDILVEDGLLFALDAHGREVLIFDVSDPVAASEIGRVYLGAHMYNMAYDSGTLYLTQRVDANRMRLHTYDVRNPSRPRYLTATDIPGRGIQQMEAQDGMLLVSQDRKGLLVYDASIPASPRLIGSFDQINVIFGFILEGSKVYATSGVWILDISTCTPCPADLDGDGELTVLDFLAFQNAFDAGDPLADIDRDGRFTIFDFLAFQTAFSAGC